MFNKNAATQYASIQPAWHSQVVLQNDGQYTRTVARRSDNSNTINSNNPSTQPVAASNFPRVAVKKNIQDYIKVNSSGNTYNNIQNVHLAVQNVNDFPIDLAVIDVQYYDAQ